MTWSRRDIDRMRQGIWVAWDGAVTSAGWRYSGGKGCLCSYDELILRFRARLAVDRRAMAASWLRQVRDVREHHVTESLATAAHAEAHPEVWGDATPDVVANQRRVAAESARERDDWGGLLARVEVRDLLTGPAELPPEVLDYDPTPPGDPRPAMAECAARAHSCDPDLTEAYHAELGRLLAEMHRREALLSPPVEPERWPRSAWSPDGVDYE